MTLRRRCPGCRADNAEAAPLTYSWRQWALKRCVRCGFVYLENPPDYAGLKVEFAWEKNHRDRGRRMQAEHPIAFAVSGVWRGLRRCLPQPPDRLARRVRRWFPSGSVLDIGCGVGRHLERLPDRFLPVGIDVSEQAVRAARARLAHRGVTVICEAAVEGMRRIPDDSLSGVIMLSFLEHETRPVDLLAEVARALAKRGRVIVKVPNYACLNRRLLGRRWCGFHFPGHVNYFTPASLAAMVRSAGFDVVDFGWLDRFWLSDTMWLVAERRTVGGDAVPGERR